jgi:hypothetical protein
MRWRRWRVVAAAAVGGRRGGSGIGGGLGCGTSGGWWRVVAGVVATAAVGAREVALGARATGWGQGDQLG